VVRASDDKSWFGGEITSEESVDEGDISTRTPINNTRRHRQECHHPQTERLGGRENQEQQESWVQELQVSQGKDDGGMTADMDRCGRVDGLSPCREYTRR
jgi:hypothetical protein